MRFGIVGNCQSRGLRDCLEVLAPDHLFELITIEPLDGGGEATLMAVTALANEVDVLFAHQPEYAVVSAEPQQALRHALSQVRPQSMIAVPTVVFGGFQPDCCVLRCNGRYIETVASLCHSAIIAGAYLSGLPAERVPALFNRFVYAGLGYVSDFVQHGHALVDSFSHLGFDARPILAAGRTFMHTPNHPAVAALFELAKQMLARVNIEPRDVPPPEDWLMQCSLQWPVYPGLPGYPFGEQEAVTPGGALQLVLGERVIPWAELIESSYACYAAHQLENADWFAPPVERAARFLREHVRP